MPELILDQNVMRQNVSIDIDHSQPNKKNPRELLNSVAEVADTFFLSGFSFLLRYLNYFELRKDGPHKLIGNEGFKSEKVKIERNPYFQPYDQAVIKGIEDFKANKPDIPLYWDKNPDYLSAEQIAKLTAAPLSENQLRLLRGLLVDPDKQSLIQSGMSTRDIIKMAPKLQFKRDTLPDLFISLLPPSLRANAREAADHTGADQRAEKDQLFIDNINTLVVEKQRPLSISDILPLFLTDNQGDISKSLLRMTLFLKWTARSKQEWLRTHVADEYSQFLSYHQMPNSVELSSQNQPPSLFEKIGGALKGFQHTRSRDMNNDLTNQLGKPYHAAHLTALLSDFSPEVLTVMTLGEYYQYSVDHGSSKMLADMFVLQSIKKINKYLQQFEHKR